MAASTITLACLLLGKNVPFEVSVAPSSSVDSLKEAIKAKLSHSLSGVDASTLELCKVDVPYAARASIKEDTLKEEDVMEPLKKVSFYFPDQGSEEHIRVVVRRPQGAPQKRPVDIDLDDFANELVKRLREDNEEKAASFPASEVSSAVMTKAMQHLKLMELPVDPSDFEQFSKMKDRQVDKFKWDEGLSEDQQMDRVLEWFKRHLKLPRHCTFTDTRKGNSLKIQLGKVCLVFLLMGMIV
ncbi:hypothetical protein M427DRAFT_39856 [Gonapodya prolifera JEL478]|uniref:Crinkler effector protein N-terminal domain-containing protein n=1 Tax=Gonapodya prolifera (strain JEL478) TaxID=1344416 RepID=A0A138ZXM1_GONPJ|nr:hypothetical protein M427DRAFT_39856 [Gonapodya prolifera JEL478]|eukprot:KXS08883.1 hypothetical protein M427DRAFT_39856 [Gonapodya prolifera JEL478]